MGARRLGREAAVQYLFQMDFHPGTKANVDLEKFWKMQEASKPTREFAEGLIQGAVEHLAEVDKKIIELADNWDLPRLAAVDRNILRLAVYELLYREDIPPVVTINEAIELAKKFGSEESGKFVNGILDRLKKDLLRPARHAVEKPKKK